MYKPKAVEQMLNITPTDLRNWKNRKLIIPSRPSPGQGSPTLYTEEDVIKIKAFKDLMQIGFGGDAARKIVFEGEKEIVDGVTISVNFNKIKKGIQWKESSVDSCG
jgi:DNA-binding transcriptional MerR regulator